VNALEFSRRFAFTEQIARQLYSDQKWKTSHHTPRRDFLVLPNAKVFHPAKMIPAAHQPARKIVWEKA
jgi:hypothetical protein